MNDRTLTTDVRVLRFDGGAIMHMPDDRVRIEYGSWHLELSFRDFAHHLVYTKGIIDSDRHRLATAAMQGLCANSIPGSHHSFKNTAQEAVEYADALMSELLTRSLRQSEGK
jgi:hypothetical protein